MVYVLTAACAVAVVFIASRMVRRLKHGVEDPDPDGPTSAHAGSMLSALFLLAFAIAIVVPWTTADSARSNTYAETQAISEAFWAASRLPAADARRLQSELREYTDVVRGPEWRLMRKDHRLSADGWARLDAMRRDTIAIKADDDEYKDARGAVLEHISEISAARHQRAMDARTSPPASLLIVTLLSGLVVMLLPFLSGARPRGMTLIPLGVMAALLALGCYLVLDIMRPFTGALAVAPDAFTNLQGELQRITGGG
ncbi:bestrophin-like domain [Actinomadura fibrosa]|uniref:DUF4239 domain-containing protein n=1 Tax=Actinomadura fibrosa TaxID=111802 RepID=A0ABW2Y0B5_9ACTN|nr:DUF4239 domain-containing protein [Actinomadura fibrosa]